MKVLNITKDQLSNIWFTADPHFNHANIIKYCNRPFKDELHMNSILISNWNSVVKPSDYIFILGDFCKGGNYTWNYFLNMLNGNKILIVGNHDKDGAISTSLFTGVYEGFLNILVEDPEIKDGQRITLCHYPMLSWYQSHRGAWQLFGHWHSRKIKTVISSGSEQEAIIFEENKQESKLSPRQYDVGVDGNDFTPISYYQVKKIIQSRNEEF